MTAFHSNVLAAGETWPGVCFCHRTWKGPCSSFYSHYCKNLPPPVTNTSTCPSPECLCLCVSRLTFSARDICPPRTLSSQILPPPTRRQPPSQAGGSAVSLLPPQGCLPRQCERGFAQPWFWPRRRSAQTQSTEHSPAEQEQWSSRGSLAGQVSTGTDETNPCHLNSFPAKTRKMIP